MIILFSFLKIVSGEDDLPKRDDIGERRRKHELRVLAGAGIEPMEGGDGEDDDGTVGVDKDADDMDDNDNGTEESEDEFYKQVKQQRAAKLAVKAETYSRYPFFSMLKNGKY